MDMDSLCQYLTINRIACEKATLLVDGGVVNYVWRITSVSGPSSIIKHASHHLRVNEKFLVPVDRMDYEVQALTTVPQLLGYKDLHDLNIQLPTLTHYDAENHVLQISDGGSRNLKAAYADLSLDIQALGRRLGHWLARLHLVTSSTAVLPTIKEQFDNLSGKRIYRTNFNGLAASLKSFGYDFTLGERMNQRFGTLLETDQLCLCHGDYWPANIIVGDSESQSPSPMLTIIDWELTRIGNGATDVGQFAAEAWLLDKFGGPRMVNFAFAENRGRGLINAFLEAYLDRRALSLDDKLRVAAQFGTHIAYLPSVVTYPASSLQPVEMVKTGNDILEMVDAGDIVSLKRTAVGLLFEE